MGKRRVSFAAPYPGKIICVDLPEHQNSILCQKDSFLCAALGTQVSIAFQKRLGAGFFGGEGFILQKLIGNGKAFIHAGGTIVKKQLNGESLRVDTGCIVAFEESVNYDVEMAGGLKSMVFGGEGMFLATLRGFGTVWLQSLPFSGWLIAYCKRAVRGKDQGGFLVGWNWPDDRWGLILKFNSSQCVYESFIA